MITKNYTCRKCNSKDIIKNGNTSYGSQQYRCKACGAGGVLELKVKYTQEDKERILRAYQERSSMRGIARTFGVHRNTLTSWLKKNPNSFLPFQKP